MFGITSFVGVILAAAAKIAIGMLWYSPKVFGSWWQKVSGVNTDKDKMPVALVGSTLMAVVTASVLASLAIKMHIVDIYSGAMLGFGAWLGFALPVHLAAFFWANNSIQLVILNSGCDLASLVVMGIIIALL